jgi:anti-sigma B factor antagonist
VSPESRSLDRSSPPPPFSTAGSLEGARYRLRLVGELDLAAMPTAHAGLAGAFDAPWETLLVDLAELSFTDSSGVRFVLEARARCATAGRGFAVRRGPADVHRVFELTGLHRALPFED